MLDRLCVGYKALIGLQRRFCRFQSQPASWAGAAARRQVARFAGVPQLLVACVKVLIALCRLL